MRRRGGEKLFKRLWDRRLIYVRRMLDKFLGKHSLSWVVYHIVWILKYCCGILVGKVRMVLMGFSGGKLRLGVGRMIAMEIMLDHIHVFLQADKKTHPTNGIRGLSRRNFFVKYEQASIL